MKRKLQFYWNFITNSSFRSWVYYQDIIKYQNEIIRMIKEKQEYESRKLYEKEYN